MRTTDPELRQRRRAELLTAAAECFSSRGFAATRVADIARKAGVSSGTLFYYFADKRSVLLELIDSEAAEIADVDVPSDAAAARSIMRTIFDDVCRQADDPVSRGLALEVAALSRRDDDVAARAERSDAALRKLFGELAVAGGSAVGPDVAGTWLAALVDGVFTRAAVQAGFSAVDSADDLHRLIDRFLYPAAAAPE